MSTIKLPALGNVPDSIDDPTLKMFLQRIKQHIEAYEGSMGAGQKRPTVQDMITAGIPNATSLPTK